MFTNKTRCVCQILRTPYGLSVVLNTKRHSADFVTLVIKMWLKCDDVVVADAHVMVRIVEYVHVYCQLYTHNILSYLPFINSSVLLIRSVFVGIVLAQNHMLFGNLNPATTPPIQCRYDCRVACNWSWLSLRCVTNQQDSIPTGMKGPSVYSCNALELWTPTHMDRVIRYVKWIQFEKADTGGWVQDCGNFRALGMELPQSCVNPTPYMVNTYKWWIIIMSVSIQNNVHIVGRISYFWSLFVIWICIAFSGISQEFFTGFTLCCAWLWVVTNTLTQILHFHFIGVIIRFSPCR